MIDRHFYVRNRRRPEGEIALTDPERLTEQAAGQKRQRVAVATPLAIIDSAAAGRHPDPAAHSGLDAKTPRPLFVARHARNVSPGPIGDNSNADVA